MKKQYPWGKRSQDAFILARIDFSNGVPETLLAGFIHPTHKQKSLAETRDYRLALHL
jgi:hypothetical protein